MGNGNDARFVIRSR